MSQQLTSLLMYSLYAPTWTARKLDKKATAQVKEANGVKDSVNAGNFNKLILPDCTELEAITAHVGSVRNGFYLRTAPWGEARGMRAGKAEDHMDLMSWFGDRQEEQKPLVHTFGVAYSELVAKAEYDMHGMFNVEDYPPWDVVEGKFALRLSVTPLPNVKDIRVMTEIPAHVRQQIEHAIQKDMHDVYASSIVEAFTTLLEPIRHMSNQLRAYDAGKTKKIFESLTVNVAKMADAARRLNIARDPRIEAIAAEAESLVEGVTKADLKDNDLFRASKAKAAEELANRIAQFIP